MRILQLPADDALLHQISEPVPADFDWDSLLTKLHETLVGVGPHGVGLSAVQIGIHFRMFIARVERNLRLFLNPVIIQTDGPYLPGMEGCLSIPGETVTVRRWNGVIIKPVQHPNAPNLPPHYYSGHDARIIQHELDHLDGILMTDRAKRQQEDINGLIPPR